MPRVVNRFHILPADASVYPRTDEPVTQIRTTDCYISHINRNGHISLIADDRVGGLAHGVKGSSFTNRFRQGALAGAPARPHRLLVNMIDPRVAGRRGATAPAACRHRLDGERVCVFWQTAMICAC